MSGLRRVIVGASGSPSASALCARPNALPAPAAPRWYPFMPGSHPVGDLAGRRWPVSTSAAPGPTMPGSGWQKSSKLRGNSHQLT